MKHTPGPWTASLGNLIRVFAAPGHIVVCGVHKLGSQTGEYGPEAVRECEANARLIAAAPDMLTMLQEAALQLEYLANKFGETGTGASVLARIHATIAKAQDQTS